LNQCCLEILPKFLSTTSTQRRSCSDLRFVRRLKEIPSYFPAMVPRNKPLLDNKRTSWRSTARQCEVGRLMATSSKDPANAVAIAVGLAAAAYLTLVVRFAWSPTPFAQGLAAVGVAAAFTYASFAYGLKHALALFLACTAITFAMENLGVATGFPFGHYHFQVAPNHPHIDAI